MPTDIKSFSDDFLHSRVSYYRYTKKEVNERNVTGRTFVI